MASISSSTLAATIAQPSSTAPPIAPVTPPTIPTIAKIVASSTLESIYSTSSGSLLREGAGVAINAFYIAMFILLGLCVLLCIISSACWCYMKHRQNNRFNNFMNTPPGHPESRHERDEEP